MSSDGKASKPPSRVFLQLRRFVSALSIIAVVLYLIFLIADAHEYHKKVVDGEVNASAEAYAESMRADVQRQLDALTKVDPWTLASKYSETLGKTNCNWFFFCTAIDFGGNNHLQRVANEMTTVPPPIFVPWSSFPIPTAHTIRGTPYALLVTAGAIAGAGGWAIAMYLSCAVLWGALMVLVLTSKEGSVSYVPYLMLVGAPFWISVLVKCVQWVAEAALARAGWAVGLVALVLAHSGALAVLVGIPHVLRSPREIREAAEVFHGVS
jgi:hypothetical protein